MWELTPVIPASAGWGHQDSEFLGQFGINQQDPISKKEGVRSDEEFGWGLLTSRPLLPVQFGSLAFLTSWLPCRQNRDPRERKCKLLKSWVSFGLWFPGQIATELGRIPKNCGRVKYISISNFS